MKTFQRENQSSLLFYRNYLHFLGLIISRRFCAVGDLWKLQVSPHMLSEISLKTSVGPAWTPDFISKCNAMQCSAAASLKFCFRRNNFLSHGSFVCTKVCFSISVGSLIPCFCCWGGNEGAAGNSGNWIFYYYFRNIPLIEERAVLYTDGIPKHAEAHLPEIKIIVTLKLIGSWVESVTSHKRERLQCLQRVIQFGQSAAITGEPEVHWLSFRSV